MFRQLSDAEVDSIGRMKADHVAVASGAVIISEGEVGGPVYTLFEGWAVRWRPSPEGRRQILDIVLPGDTIGLGAALIGMVDHSVQTITPATLCVLQADQVVGLLDRHRELAWGLLRTRMEEECRADTRLMLMGRTKAAQRLAYLMLDVVDRLRRRGLVDGGATFPFPLQRRDLADAAGLSQVHVVRTLDRLRRSRLADIHDGVLTVFDSARLVEFAGYRPPRMAVGRAIL